MNHLTLTRLFNQPAKTTWQPFKNFNAVPIPGAVVTMEGENNVVGSVRTINYDNGTTVVERLDAFVDSGPQYMFAYRFTEPMLGVKQYAGTWIVYPIGKDGKRSAMKMFLTWEPDDDKSNEVFESIAVDLLQNGYLAAPDPTQDE